MLSYHAFNSMMEEFASEMVRCFPDKKSLKKMKMKLDLLMKTDPESVVKEFMSSVEGHQDAIMKSDESVFDHPDLQDLKLNKIIKEASAGTKSAIWQYMQQLLLLGTSITAIPPDIMSKIESSAKEMTEGGGGLDMGKIMELATGLAREITTKKNDRSQ